MTTISITIDDTKLSRFLDAVDYGFPGRPSATPKGVWARQQLVTVLNNLDLAYRQHLADIAVDPADTPVT